jgi:hypothetical protein
MRKPPAPACYSLLSIEVMYEMSVRQVAIVGGLAPSPDGVGTPGGLGCWGGTS